MADTRFLVDCMMGTLAKWLRILGFDTVYETRLDDHSLVRLARAEGRLLLTRDRNLARRKGLAVLFIESESVDEQLVQVLSAVRSRDHAPFSRCPVCNAPLEQVPKYEAWGQVPPFVFQTQQEFHLCPECNRFYWRGTHWQKMVARVKELQK
jgi:hypothetical protein